VEAESARTEQASSDLGTAADLLHEHFLAEVRMVRAEVEMVRAAALEATQGQMDGFFSQLQYNFEVASVGG